MFDWWSVGHIRDTLEPLNLPSCVNKQSVLEHVAGHLEVPAYLVAFGEESLCRELGRQSAWWHVTGQVGLPD